MSNSTPLPRISQAPQSQKSIYFILQKSKKGLTRSSLAKASNYALTTTRDALQALAKKGLIYYNKVLRCWFIKAVKQAITDLYDAYINLKKDWKGFISRIGGKRMAVMRLFISDDESMQELKIPHRAKPIKNLEKDLAKDLRRDQMMRTSPYYKG